MATIQWSDTGHHGDPEITLTLDQTEARNLADAVTDNPTWKPSWLYAYMRLVRG
jgi:hypothetical protein